MEDSKGQANGEPVNPIRVFFSGENAKNLFALIKRGLKEQYEVEIDGEYYEQLIEIMKMVKEPLPKKIPRDVNVKWFVETLNKRTLKEALPIFAEIARESRPLDVPLRPSGQMNLGAPARPLNSHSTPISAVRDRDDDAFERLQRERAPPRAMEPVQPHFEDPPMEYPDDINELYQDQEAEREYEREFASSEPEPEMVSSTPLSFRESTQLYPEDGSNPPRGAERLPQRLPQSEMTDVDFAAQSGRLFSMGDIAPTPAQMRVLIPRNSRNTVHDSRMIPHYYVVSSGDRIPSAYPSPSEYRVELRVPYVDVVSVELTSASVPLTFYTVNEQNNRIEFEEMAGTTLTAFIPIGDYPDSTTLAMAVATSMTAASANGVTYTGSVSGLTGKVTLTSDLAGGSIFSLIFFGSPVLEGEGTPEFRREVPQYREGSIGEILGYAPQDYSGSASYEAPAVPDLDGDPWIYLHIDELEHLESNNSNVHDAFAQISTVPSGSSNVSLFLPTDSYRFIKYFSPPMGKLSNLTISFRDARGNLIDFNGRNHTLTFEIITKDVTQGPYEE